MPSCITKPTHATVTALLPPFLCSVSDFLGYQMSLPTPNFLPKYRQCSVSLISAIPSADHGIRSLKWRMRFVVALGPLPVHSIISTFMCNCRRACMKLSFISPSIFKLIRNTHVLYHTSFNWSIPLLPAHT